MTYLLQRNKIYNEGPFKFFRGNNKELDAQIELENKAGEKSRYLDYEGIHWPNSTASNKHEPRCVNVFVRVPVGSRKVFGEFRFKKGIATNFMWVDLGEADYLITYDNFYSAAEDLPCPDAGVLGTWRELVTRLSKEVREQKKAELEKTAKKLGLSVLDYKKKLALERLEKTNVKYAAERVGLLMKATKLRTTIDSVISAIQKNMISEATVQNVDAFGSDLDFLSWDLQRHATRNVRLDKLRTK